MKERTLYDVIETNSLRDKEALRYIQDGSYNDAMANYQNSAKQNFLHKAIQNNKPLCAQYFIQQQTKESLLKALEAKDINGLSPIHYMVIYYQIHLLSNDIFPILSEQNKSYLINKQDPLGLTLYDLATHLGDNNIARTFEPYVNQLKQSHPANADDLRAQLMAIMNNSHDKHTKYQALLQLITENKQLLNKRDIPLKLNKDEASQYGSLLHWACYHKLGFIVEIILARQEQTLIAQYTIDSIESYLTKTSGHNITRESILDKISQIIPQHDFDNLYPGFIALLDNYLSDQDSSNLLKKLTEQLFDYYSSEDVTPGLMSIPNNEAQSEHNQGLSPLSFLKMDGPDYARKAENIYQNNIKMIIQAYLHYAQLSNESIHYLFNNSQPSSYSHQVIKQNRDDNEPHNNIQQLISRCHQDPEALNTGYCHGFTKIFQNSFLLGQSGQFTQRMERAQWGSDKIFRFTEIDHCQQMIYQKIQLDHWAFADSARLMQIPELFIKPQTVQQTLEKHNEPILGSDENGDLSTLGEAQKQRYNPAQYLTKPTLCDGNTFQSSGIFCGYFSPDDLQEALIRIKQQFIENDSIAPFVVNIGTKNHIVAISYSPTEDKPWALIDIDNWPIKRTTDDYLNRLASIIITPITIDDDEHRLIDVEIATSANNASLLNQIYKSLETIQKKTLTQMSQLSDNSPSARIMLIKYIAGLLPPQHLNSNQTQYIKYLLTTALLPESNTIDNNELTFPNYQSVDFYLARLIAEYPSQVSVEKLKMLNSSYHIDALTCVYGLIAGLYNDPQNQSIIEDSIYSLVMDDVDSPNLKSKKPDLDMGSLLKIEKVNLSKLDPQDYFQVLQGQQRLWQLLSIYRNTKSLKSDNKIKDPYMDIQNELQAYNNPANLINWQHPKTKETPLKLAYKSGFLKTARVLLQAGGKLDHTSANEITPNDKVAIEAHEKDPFETTQLHLAILSGNNEQAIDIAMHNNALISTPDSLGYKPYELAQQLEDDIQYEPLINEPHQNTDVSPATDPSRSSENISPETSGQSPDENDPKDEPCNTVDHSLDIDYSTPHHDRATSNNNTASSSKKNSWMRFFPACCSKNAAQAYEPGNTPEETDHDRKRNQYR